MAKATILTGLRANNDLTLGNYFGAILPMVDMVKQKSLDYQINMFIPDLHSFTTPINHDELYGQIMHNARLFVAAGLPLDNDNIHLYRQSHISAHSELTWILDCFTGFGQMSRMTQFKEKSGMQDIFSRIDERLTVRERIADEGKGFDEVGKTEFEFLKSLLEDLKKGESVTVGLFNYPVLMAADILLYNAEYVPVGEDQTQHLEFARDIAERMNSKFGDVFTMPKAVKVQHEFFKRDQGLRIKDLQDPTKKMSKSDDSGKGVIFLGDDPKLAANKIMSATTDDKAEVRFDKVNQPGITNLLEILALLRGVPLQQVIAEFEGQTRYGDFKKVVANETERFLLDFQAKLEHTNDYLIQAKLERSEEKMRSIANETLLRAQRAVGLRPKEA
jgi:tryptophanyl-tRNA synthetase